MVVDCSIPNNKAMVSGKKFMVIWYIFNPDRTLLTLPIVNVSASNLAEKLAENLVEKITIKQSEVIVVLMENPKATASIIADQLGISQQAVSERIKLLKKKGVIRRVGADKGGYWEVLKSARE